MAGMTQPQLAELIGITYQQEHKYEKGINRIAAGRLYQIARVLGVDVGYFYEGLQSEQPFVPTYPSGGGHGATAGVEGHALT
jgi:transcriptional regulator with XRE-family HTH domain